MRSARRRAEVLGRRVPQPVEQPGIALLQGRLQLVHRADGRQARSRPGIRPAAASLLVFQALVDGRVHHHDDPRVAPERQPLQGLDPPPAGQVVADRPERPPALGTLAASGRRLLILGGPLVVDQVPRHGEECPRVGRPLLDDDLQSDQPDCFLRSSSQRRTLRAVSSSLGRRQLKSRKPASASLYEGSQGAGPEPRSLRRDRSQRLAARRLLAGPLPAVAAGAARPAASRRRHRA